MPDYSFLPSQDSICSLAWASGGLGLLDQEQVILVWDYCSYSTSLARCLQSCGLFYNKPKAYAFSFRLRFGYKLSLFGSIVEGSHRLVFYGVVPFYNKPIAWAFFTKCTCLKWPIGLSFDLVLNSSILFFPGKDCGLSLDRLSWGKMLGCCLNTVVCSCSIYCLQRWGYSAY